MTIRETQRQIDALSNQRDEEIRSAIEKHAVDIVAKNDDEYPIQKIDEAIDIKGGVIVLSLWVERDSCFASCIEISWDDDTTTEINDIKLPL